MKIKILSDSTCDLPQHLLEQYDITLTAMSIIKNDKVFKDGVTITPADIFAHVEAGGAICTTSAISVGEYQDYFEPYARDYDAVIQITVGSCFSSSYQNACLAAEEFDNVRVFDSRNFTVGQGLIAMKASELARNCSSVDALLADLENYASRVETSFVVDKLDYLVKGGRCSAVAALGANLLNLKPCIEVRDNKLVVVKKYRGSLAKCLTSYVKDRLEDREDLDTSAIFVDKTQVSQEVYNSVLDAVSAYGKFDSVHESIAGCAISCHCGPGTMGIMFVRK